MGINFSGSSGSSIQNSPSKRSQKQSNPETKSTKSAPPPKPIISSPSKSNPPVAPKSSAILAKSTQANSQTTTSSSKTTSKSPIVKVKEITRPFSKSVQAPPSEYYSAGSDAYSCQMQFSQSSTSSTKTEIYKIRKSDRSKVEVTIIQDSNKSAAQVIAHIYPFVPLNPAQLEESSANYGSLIVQYAIDRLGKRVGNGECWTLADEAVKSSGASHAIG